MRCDAMRCEGGGGGALPFVVGVAVARLNDLCSLSLSLSLCNRSRSHSRFSLLQVGVVERKKQPTLATGQGTSVTAERLRRAPTNDATTRPPALVANDNDNLVVLRSIPATLSTPADYHWARRRRRPDDSESRFTLVPLSDCNLLIQKINSIQHVTNDDDDDYARSGRIDS